MKTISVMLVVTTCFVRLAERRDAGDLPSEAVYGGRDDIVLPADLPDDRITVRGAGDAGEVGFLLRRAEDVLIRFVPQDHPHVVGAAALHDRPADVLRGDVHHHHADRLLRVEAVDDPDQGDVGVRPGGVGTAAVEL